MKRIKQDKVKRGRIILSAILTMLTALISLGFGAYLGYVTLSINYLTIGTMTPAVGGLLVVAGFFIFFGCIGGVISLKELFISSRNEEKFSAYKPALISAMIYYVIIAIISLIGIIVALISFIPSNFTWTIVGLALLSLLLCAGSFYLVLKELKEHKKKQKAAASGASLASQAPLGSQPSQGSQVTTSANFGIANMELSAQDIHDFSAARAVPQADGSAPSLHIDNRPMYNSQSRQAEQGQPFDRQHLYDKYLKEEKVKKDVDFVALAERLMQLEELRKAGLINDQEYQELKKQLL